MTITGRRVTLIFLILILLTGLACSLSSIGGGTADSSNAPTATAAAVVSTSNNIPANNAPTISTQNAFSPELESALISLYENTHRSVVHIMVYTSINDALPLGSGSGFVYDNEGHIVTNNHVVEDGSVFEIIFSDGSRRRADVIGRDVDSDLAVIQVDSLPEGVQPLQLGDSDQIQVGQFVVAIGNPFAEQVSMAVGIISGLSRSLESQRALEDPTLRYSLPEVIQTDAPINPGNSGGPLINLQGEVLGVNSAIRSTTGFNSGVGFSIPVNAVRRIIPSLIANGSYTYSYMGVQIRSLNLNSQEQLGLPQVTGAYLVAVTPGGPADDSNLIAANESDGRGGDLIIAIDDSPVLDTEQLIAYLVFHTEVGQTVSLTVLREGETVTVPVTLTARP